MTRKMSRYGAMILAVVLLVGLSCSVAAQKKVTIVHWQHHSPARFEVVQTFAEEFMKQNPNVRIEIESVLKRLLSKLLPTCGWIRARHVPDPQGRCPHTPLPRNPAYRHSRWLPRSNRGRSFRLQSRLNGRKSTVSSTDDCPVCQPSLKPQLIDNPRRPGMS